MTHLCLNCDHADEIEGRDDCLYCQKIGKTVATRSIGCKNWKKQEER